MSVDLLAVCEWSGPHSRDTIIEHPSWTDIEAAIRALNGTTHNDLYIYPSGSDTDTYLCIGGGSGRYIVSGATHAGEFPTLADPQRAAEPKQRVIVGGQPGDYPGHWVVTLEAALRAARAFFEAGAFTSDIPWVQA